MKVHIVDVMTRKGVAKGQPAVPSGERTAIIDCFDEDGKAVSVKADSTTTALDRAAVSCNKLARTADMDPQTQELFEKTASANLEAADILNAVAVQAHAADDTVKLPTSRKPKAAKTRHVHQTLDIDLSKIA